MNLHILEKLDYTLYSDQERVQLARELIAGNTKEIDLENMSEQKQLEGIANFILYGKEENTEKSIVDRKRVFIKAKYNSFAKKEPESLEALQESVSFNEAEIKELGTKNVYTKPKQKISREDDLDIPGIIDLWSTIDTMQYMYDISSGKKTPTQEDILNGKVLSGLRLYKWRHWLIDVRRHQFYLKDAYKKTIHFINIKQPQHSQIDWCSNSQYRTEEGLHIVREHILDFTNPDHIYYLLEYYGELKQSTYEDTTSQMRFILYTLEELIEKTELSPNRMDILIMKVDKKINKRICEHLKLTYGLDYNENYISTIWKQEICKKIAAQADLDIDQYNARHYPKAWKYCRDCGEVKLKDEREFVKKNTSADGLSNRCKKCDKKKRDKNKV